MFVFAFLDCGCKNPSLLPNVVVDNLPLEEFPPGSLVVGNALLVPLEEVGDSFAEMVSGSHHRGVENSV